MTADLKPDADRIAARLRALSAEPWLGSTREWWPRYLFHVTDVENAARILDGGKLLSRARCEALGLLRKDSASRQVLEQTDPRWKDYVRFYFRPRTPFQYHTEGIRPLARRGPLAAHCPMPVVLLFDAKSVLTRRGTRFSNGNLAANPLVDDSAEFFESLPFERIYHDTWMTDEEKRSVVFHRHAEVIVPHEITLTALRLIWCRSPAETETLEALVRPTTWGTYQQQAGSSARPNMFFRRWTFVERAILRTDRVQIHFNASTLAPGPYVASATFSLDSGDTARWSDENFDINKYGDAGELTLTLPGSHAYSFRLFLDENLAYAGSYTVDKEWASLF